ncbi:hypothetical protein PHPALM_9746 [Phytophthora palmivora]|uniref:Uncharacterized protein n=1 Tax=Phytophthora palmivora TaxID=4796 RepID=A0A2P4Y6V6_9STRA|nr:hypothetical protein PHPALM_9746 [Phytophthora palmivora]
MQSSSRSELMAPTADAPLTAERAMMDQIRSKLERAQRRLARNAPSSSSSIASSRYIPSSEYNSAMHKPPVKSVRLEDMSKHYGSMAPPPSTRHGPPPSTMRHPSSRQPPPSSRHSRYPESSRYAHQQYKSRSKYSQGNFEDADPLNGGPPPMSTPYLVYSNSRPPMTGSQHKSSRPTDRRRHEDEKYRHRVPNSNVNGPPSAMRSGIARPPTSRVRFEGHESEMRESMAKMERESEKRRQMKEREARHQKLREQEIKNINARAKGTGPSSPIAATHGRRSGSVENPPSSAIKLSAYEDIAQAIPTSPVGRPRRSSISNPPPKSDIKISAFDDIIPRRRSSGDNQPKPAEQPKQKAQESPEVIEAETDADEGQVSDNQMAEQEISKQGTAKQEVAKQEIGEPTSRQLPVAEKLPPPSVVPEPEVPSRSDEEDTGDTSAYDTDDSYDYEFDSDSEYLSSGYSMFEAHVVEVDVHEDEDVPTPPATELSTVKEEDEDDQAPTSRLTARDLAFHALGRTSTCSLSDIGSPVPSANGRESPNGSSTFVMDPSNFYEVTWKLGEFAFSVQRVYTAENEYEFDDRNQEPQLFLRMLLNTERSTCKSFHEVRGGDVLIRVGDAYVSELGLEGSGTVLTKFFAKLTAQTPIKLTFQRMCPSDWEGGVEL